jgi:hypothetical protein
VRMQYFFQLSYNQPIYVLKDTSQNSFSSKATVRFRDWCVHYLDGRSQPLSFQSGRNKLEELRKYTLALA